MSHEEKRKFKPVVENYEVSHYQSKMEAEKGLAETHEQVSDSYLAQAGETITSEKEKK